MAACGIEGARDDAELLLAHALGMPRAKLIVEGKLPLNEKIRQKFNRFVSRRADGREPVAYIMGTAGFYGLEFVVSPSVLIPRPATETLVELAVRRLPADGRFADIGAGSGAIAIAVLTRHKRATGVATDIEQRAIDIVRQNARLIGVSDRLEVRHGDLLEPLGPDRFDAILSNPPYVAEHELPKLAPELQHEPKVALVSGPTGLETVERVVAGARARLKEGGTLLVEIGAGQGARVRELAFHAGFGVVQFHRDLEGIDRVLEAR